MQTPKPPNPTPGKKPKGRFSAVLFREAVAAASAGFYNREISQLIGISERTFYYWMQKRAEFARAIASARLPRNQTKENSEPLY